MSHKATNESCTSEKLTKEVLDKYPVLTYLNDKEENDQLIISECSRVDDFIYRNIYNNKKYRVVVSQNSSDDTHTHEIDDTQWSLSCNVRDISSGPKLSKHLISLNGGHFYVEISPEEGCTRNETEINFHMLHLFPKSSIVGVYDHFEEGRVDVVIISETVDTRNMWSGRNIVVYKLILGGVTTEVRLNGFSEIRTTEPGNEATARIEFPERIFVLEDKKDLISTPPLEGNQSNCKESKTKNENGEEMCQQLHEKRYKAIENEFIELILHSYKGEGENPNIEKLFQNELLRLRRRSLVHRGNFQWNR